MRASWNPSGSERGFASLVSIFLVIVLGGLSISLLREALAGRTTLRRHDNNARALEIAEAGLVRAEMEILGEQDTGNDGVGSLTTSFGGGTVEVSAVPDASGRNLWRLTATGSHGLSSRTIIEKIRRNPANPWLYAAFGRDGVSMDASATDMYDSRLGPYALQLSKSDAKGPYAQVGGSIGSNRGITINGNTRIRGDARPGPGYTTTGTPANVYGSRTPLKTEVKLPYTPIEEFKEALASPDNGTWTRLGGSVAYDAARRSLALSGGATLILDAGTYFFTDITVSGNSVIKTNGPVKIYTTGAVDFSGGTILNSLGAPADFQLFSHPYTTLVPAYAPPATSLTISSNGSATALVTYGPESPLTFSGNGNLFGSFIAKRVTNSGGVALHYDKALTELGTVATISHLFWAEPKPPAR